MLGAAAFAPLRHPAFRLLWWANLASNTGQWVQSTGAGWLMTSLDPSPSMVSLVQVASLLPVFLLALPAGALADIIDRRRFLLAAQAWMLGVGLVLALLTGFDALGPWGLIALTFAVGAGSAMNFPGWAATTPELVPREDLTQAIVLGGIGFNLARAVGPALGGVIIGLAGVEAAFAFNALCFAVMIAALLVWRREEVRERYPKEHFLSAMRNGVRFVVASPALRACIVRAEAFFFFGAAIWGLLPLLVREQLGLGPEAFGLLLGCMGLGAVGAGFLLPALRARFNRSATVLGASLLTCAALLVLAATQHWAAAGLGMALYGVAWITGASTLQAAAQLASPAWVRARAIGIYQVCFFGALALGSALAGVIADRVGVAPTLAGFGVAGLAAALLVRRYGADFAAAGLSPAPAASLPRPDAPAPELAPVLAEESGRVLEAVRYYVDPARRDAFLATMEEVRQVRQRAGALSWQLYEDIAHPERWVELWIVESWTEHLREADRLEPGDRAVLARALACNMPGMAPEAARYLRIAP
jgi:MFS family permease